MVCEESNYQRISFAGNLGQSVKGPPMEQQQQPSGPVRRDTTLLESSNSDFEFHVSKNFDPGDSSPADEIFADGMILPVLPFQVTTPADMPKRLYKYELPPIVCVPSLTSSSFPPPLRLPEHSRKYSEKGTQGNGRGSSANLDSEAKRSSKLFWSFTRSSSLNCDMKNSLICSFPLLTRSHSTGSLVNSKRAMLRDINKHSSQRHGLPRPGGNSSSHMPTSSSSYSSLCCSSYQFTQHKEAGQKGAGRGSFWVALVMGGPSPFGLDPSYDFQKRRKRSNS